MDNSNLYREKWIDSLKGLFILLIIMTHSGLSNYGGIIGRIASAGKYAVVPFLTISTFVLLKSFERNGKNIFNWYKKRYLKLIPFYFLCIIVYAVAIGGNAFWYGSDGHITAWNYLAHFFLINSFFPKYINSIIGVEWYISILFILILLIPLIYKFVKKKELSLVLFFISIILYFISCRIQGILHINGADIEIYNSYFWWMSFIPNMYAISMGSFLYIISKENSKLEKREKLIVSYSTLLFSAWMIYEHLYGKSEIYYFPIYFIWGLIFFLIIYSQYVHSSRLINNMFFRMLGRNSFVMYLIHPLLFYYLEKVEFLNKGYGMFIKFLLGVVISMIISVCYNYIEKKIISRGLF